MNTTMDWTVLDSEVDRPGPKWTEQTKQDGWTVPNGRNILDWIEMDRTD